MEFVDMESLPVRPRVRVALAEARRALDALYGERLAGVVLFGSQARGEGHEDSDLDLVVVLRGPFDPYEEARRTSRLMLETTLRHGEALSLLHLSEEQFTNRRHPLLMNVLDEGVVF